ncbi:calcitonin gene-related peptide-like [Pristis pectinata]|uniref:calcitonin gene-related peptide-like n=1 Tax=Pristis pectinata TaxID=685728 RepID=UPI00223C9345|nr:calcitonin gene-related peptide-like [Pristis pectinata]
MLMMSFPVSLVLACAMAVSMDSDHSSLRSPGSPHPGKVLIRRVDGHYLPGLTQRQLLQPVTAYVQDHHNQRARRLLLLHKQKRSCNTATCVTFRLANFLSRSGAMGSSSFIPTDVGAKAFGRKRREVPV